MKFFLSSFLIYISTSVVIPNFIYSCTMSKSSNACCSKQKVKEENPALESNSCCDENSKETQNDCEGKCNHKNCKCRIIPVIGLLKNYMLYSLVVEFKSKKFQIQKEPLHKGYVSHWFLPKIG